MTAAPVNPLIDDRDVELILDEVLDLPRLLELPYFTEHDRDTCQMFVESCRDLARDVLFPAYRTLDADPPKLVDGKVSVERTRLAGMTDHIVIHATQDECLPRNIQSPLQCSAFELVTTGGVRGLGQSSRGASFRHRGVGS